MAKSRKRGIPFSQSDALERQKILSKTTFSELGIPFPLFEATVNQADRYVGFATCSICTKTRQPAFVLGIGCYLMLPCPSCATVSGLNADDRKESSCRECDSVIPFPDIATDKILCCY